MRRVLRWVVRWILLFLKMYPVCHFCGEWMPCNPNCIASAHCHSDCLKQEKRRRWKDRVENIHSKSREDLN